VKLDYDASGVEIGDKNPNEKEPRMPDEIDLSPEDEDTLDRAWAKIHQEKAEEQEARKQKTHERLEAKEEIDDAD
jgi:hypothetical protein